MLLASDKSKGKRGTLKWSGWYKTAIPQAEKIYKRHIAELGERND